MMHHCEVYKLSFYRIVLCCGTALLLLLSHPPGRAQSPPDAITLTPGFGFMVPHRKELRNLVSGHSRSLAIGMEFHTRNAPQTKAWHSVNRFPSYGLEFYYADLGNPRQLGRQFALSAYLRLPAPFLSEQPKRRWSMHSIWGLGAGYSDTTWDLEANPKGIALGSALNICLTAGYGVQYRFSPRFSGALAVRMTHFSNGAVRLPNLGTNNLTSNLSLMYQLRDASSELPKEAPLPNDDEGRVHKFFGTYSIGIKENLPPGGPMHFVHTIGLGFRSRPGERHGFVLRTDLWYNLAISSLMARDVNYEMRRSDRIQQGVAAGYARYFGKAHFEVHMGAYLYTRFEGNGLFYHRFILSHEVTDRLRATLGLKTHWARADHPEFGLVGYF